MSTPLRRSDRAVSRQEALDYLNRAEVGFLALANDNVPYVVPLHFARIGEVLYFHCSPVGRKLDMLAKNPYCSIAVSFLDGIKEGERACDYGTYYHSAVAFGKARIVEDTDEKITALNELTRKHATRAFVPVNAAGASTVTVMAINITELSGKARS